MHVVICGGGVVGACIAFFLARRGIGVTVVERAGVASSASGKAGGFLALDWCAGSPLDALARRTYDVILMDVHMPEMDGLEATQRILSGEFRPPLPYIIAMTAAAMQEDRERCRAAGMHDFIPKPVQIEGLKGALLRARKTVTAGTDGSDVT